MAIILSVSCLLSCKNQSEHGPKLSDVQSPITDTSQNQSVFCHGPFTQSLSIEAETDKNSDLYQISESALTSIHQDIQTLFKKMNGRILVSNSEPSGTPCSNKGDLSVCWFEKEYAPTLMIISKKNSLSDDEKLNISQAIVQSFGEIYEKLLSRYTILDGKPEEREESPIDGMTIPALAEYNAKTKSQVSLSNSDSLFGLFFSEYFCNEETARLMAIGFPETSQAFDHLKTNLSSEESLGLTGGVTSAIRYVSKTKIKGFTPTDPVKPQLEYNTTSPYYKITDINDTKSVTLPDASYIRAGKGQIAVAGDYEARFGLNGWYYKGDPRLIRGNLSEVCCYDRIIKNTNPRLEGKKPINIMIPGTFQGHFVASGKWADPDGPNARLVSQTYGGTTLGFQWGGRNTKESRGEAARVLAVQIKKLYEDGFYVNVVTHSHGGNVMAEAMAILKKEGFEGPLGEVLTIARPVRSDYTTDGLATEVVQAYTRSGDYVVPIGRNDFVGTKHISTRLRISDPNADLRIEFEKASHEKMQNSLEHILNVRSGVSDGTQ